MSFAKRKIISDIGEVEVINFLTDNGFIVEYNGIEQKYKSFSNVINLNKSPAAKRIRYKPDTVALYKYKIFYVEVKCSNCIEKDAYMEYMKLANSGENVLVFFPQLDSFQNIKNIQFKNSEDILSKYNEVVRFKTDEDGWIYPRKSWTYTSNDKFSGTPYKYVELSNLIPYNNLINYVEGI